MKGLSRLSEGRTGVGLLPVMMSSLVLLVCGVLFSAEALIIREGPVRLRVLEYSSKSGSLKKVLNSRYSDLVVGEEVEKESQLVLECNSKFGPLRWVYNGDGRPQYKSYYTSTTRAGVGSSYTAYLSFPNGVSPKDTGQYLCQNSYNGSVSNYVYLFVPKVNLDGKQAIFVPNYRKHDIPVYAGDSTVRIPCSVVHPSVKVSLERVSSSKAFYLDPPERVPYNPKTGFTVTVSPYAKEMYTCRGEYKGEFEEVTYTTSPVQPRLEPEAEILEDHFFTRPTPSFASVSTPEIEESTYVTTPTTPEPTPAYPPRVPTLPPPEKNLVSACTPQYCGINAECIVKDYKPYCICFEDYTGDPKIGCHRISDHSQHLRVEDPCAPSPCGRFAECVQINGHPLCTCLEGYYGSPPKCSPHKFTNCSKNYDCEWKEYCNTDTQRCEDICEGSTKFCGKNALCTAFSHMPYCTCPPGGSYVGDPYDTEGSGCQLQTEKQSNEGKPSCNPSPCGRNAHCKVYSSYPLPICFCPQGFSGDPSHRCYKLAPAPIIDVFHPHYHTHAPPTTSTSPTPTPPPLSQVPTFSPEHPYPICTDTFCGGNARCRFRNNRPECHCLDGYKGDPYKGCHRTAISPSQLRQACSVCGPNSVCSMISSDVRCLCAPDTVGTPPNCKKVSPQTPSPFANAPSSSAQQSSYHHQYNLQHHHHQHPQVQVISTSSSTTSSAHEFHHQLSSSFTSSSLHRTKVGSSASSLRHRDRVASCSSDLDCPPHLVCYTGKRKCLNPCSWACSDSALCSVTNHHVHCNCPTGSEGNPRIHCSPTQQPERQSVPNRGHQQQDVHEAHPCRFTCGSHTVCRRIPPTEVRRLRNLAFARQEERGPFQKALVQYIKRVQSKIVSVNDQNSTKFTDPQDHDEGGHFNSDYFTECVCMKGLKGNPYSIEGCTLKDVVDNPSQDDHDLEDSSSDTSSAVAIPSDPCKPNPCGPHSLCVAFKGQAFCRCDYDSVGDPPNCSPRCGRDQHCLFDQVCRGGKCVPQRNGGGGGETGYRDRFQQDNNIIRK